MHGLIFSKWLWLAVMAIPIGIITAGYLLFKPVKSVVSRIDIIVILFFGWVYMHTLLSGSGTDDLLFYVVPTLIVWLFVRLFITDRKTIIWILITYLSIVGIQCVWGLLQLYGFVPSLHSMYNITGTFHNPGPYSGFLVSGLPMALGLFLIAQRTRRKKLKDEIRRGVKGFQVLGFEFQLPNRLWQSDVWLYYFSQLIIVLLLLVLPAARSRAAWLGGIAGCLYVAISSGSKFKAQGSKFLVSGSRLTNTTLKTRNLKPGTRNFEPKTFKLILLGFLLGLILIGSTYGIYKLKQGSADGRLLMWQVSWEMIKDKPLMGYGQGGFEANYSNYQAEWFRSGKGTPEQELVAGTPDAPFNEFVRVWVEYGAVGILLIFNTILLIFGLRFKAQGFKFRVQGSEQKNKEQETLNPELITGGLLSIIVFSLFSYPLDVAPIVIQFVILSALIINIKSTKHVTRNPEPGTRNPKLGTYSLCLFLLLLIPLQVHTLFNHYNGFTHWKEAYQLYQYQLYDDAAEEYKEAIKYMPGNGMLMQMYGKCLAMDGKWEKSKTALTKAKTLRSDPILCTALGDTYKALKEYDKAETAYWQAWYMVPHKFYPKYLLAKLYNETGQHNKAVKLAKELITKTAKIESTAVKEIKEEMQMIINMYEK